MSFGRPKGRNVVAVCHNLSCHLAGAPAIVAHLQGRLGIHAGETTADGRVTLQSVECLCACEHAPMMQVDDRYEFGLTPEKVDRILEGLRGRPRRSSRAISGAPTRNRSRRTPRRPA